MPCHQGYYAREDGSAAARRSHAGRAKDAREAEAVGAALAAALHEGLGA